MRSLIGRSGPALVAVACTLGASGMAGCSAVGDGSDLGDMTAGYAGSHAGIPSGSTGFGGTTSIGGSAGMTAGVDGAGRSGGLNGSGAGRGGSSGSGAGLGGSSESGRPGFGGSGFGGTVAAGSGGSGADESPTLLPKATQSCPSINSGNLTFLGQSVTVWAGAPSATRQGSLVIYWHGTGGSPEEAVRALGQAAIDEITSSGGMVAAQAETNGKGTNTGNNVWFTGDFAVADEVVACALEQLRIDPRRIYASGFSAGGLQASWMAYARSGYLAAVVPYSGGLTGLGTLVLTPVGMPQDPSNVPSAMAVHGREGADVLILDFAVQSRAYLSDVKTKGGFAIECDHGGGHTMPSDAGPAVWQFMKAHPFKAKPSPYASGLPSGFPSYCEIL